MNCHNCKHLFSDHYEKGCGIKYCKCKILLETLTKTQTVNYAQTLISLLSLYKIDFYLRHNAEESLFIFTVVKDFDLLDKEFPHLFMIKQDERKRKYCEFVINYE